MIRKQDQEEQVPLANSSVSQANKWQRLQSRSQKMYDSIDQVMSKTIAAINQTEAEIGKSESEWGNSLMSLHIKMTEIKPLKSVKDQYNEFYKKMSGFGKTFEDAPVDNQIKIKVPRLFEEQQIKSIEQSISDHYLSQQKYEIAQSIWPENGKRELFQQCFQLRQDILRADFDRPAQWIQKLQPNQKNNYLGVGYQIHKMKIITLVQQNKADEAIAYLRKNLSAYAHQNGAELSKLMNFIITHSNKYWGAQTDYSAIFKDRYSSCVKVELQELADSFTSVYLKVNNIYLNNPLAQCYEVGLKFRDQFIEQLKYLPEGQDLPCVLPFSIKTGQEHKYHSYFFCPISKQVFGPEEKNVMLNCGHMVSHHAISKITEGRDSRRKMKCPICQSDQIIENNMKVQF